MAYAKGGGWDFLVLIDRLDDTWNGSDLAVGLLMALMHACVELTAQSLCVHPILFLRENLFQRVKLIDTEFGRLEPSAVSLDWTPALLVEMIERRLQTAVTTKPRIGETWDCFFEPVDGQSSSQHVLAFCQNRPRDVLVYCGHALDEAQSHRHPKVTAHDLDAASRKFSLSRLKEVSDEYSENYPQIQLVIGRFHGLAHTLTIPALTQFIQKLLVDPQIQRYCQPWINEYSAPHRFAALLYDIGFIGISNNQKGTIEYRALESTSDVPDINAQSQISIHPCYRLALGLQDAIVSSLEETTLQLEGMILDLPESHTLDTYTSALAALLRAIDDIPLGKAGDAQFERFVGEAIRLCFFKSLNNVKPKERNLRGVTIRDWVASNVADTGFWNMVKVQYHATQVIWECKNYEELAADDFHQVAYYMGGAMGNFCIICFRGDPKEKRFYEHIQHIHKSAHKGMVLLLGDADLKVFIRQAMKGKAKESHIQDRYDMTARLIT